MDVDTEKPSLAGVELIVKTMAETVIANENYFCELDAVVGDGDFGYSLARGFEIVLKDFDTFDRASVGAFLKRIGIVIASRVGGTSGPLWGTAFMRAGAAAGEHATLAPTDCIRMLRAAVEGIMQRGGASLGDKTLLDSFVPAIDALEAGFNEPVVDRCATLRSAADVATRAARETASLIAKRGRASYTGERSIGSPDAGAVAVAVILQEITRAWLTARNWK